MTRTMTILGDCNSTAASWKPEITPMAECPECQRAVVRPPENRSGKSVISGRTRSVTDVEDPLSPGSVRQRKIKGRPFFDLRFGPRASAVTVDNATNIGQADASAVEFLRLVQALEHPEQ